MSNEGWRSYGSVADAYRRGRPAYPEAAVDLLLQQLGLHPGDRVADLGAGTGVFAVQLVERGLVVDAVEPVEAMRAEVPALAGLTVHATRAEATGLPSAAFRAVVAATAWHWFDAARAAAEVRRVLRPDGGLALIWTGYDERVPWVHELAEVAFRRRRPSSPSARSGRWKDEFGRLAGWEPLQERTHSSTWPTTPDGLVERLNSSSAVARLPASGQEEARRELRALLRRQGLDGSAAIDVPYRTDVYWTRPTPSDT